MSSPVRLRVARSFRALLVAAGMLGLSACELAIHEHQRSTAGGCEAWQVGCPITVDVKADGPMLTTLSDVRRAEIVDAAATAPVRACPDWPNTCPLRIMGDALKEQYFSVF